MVLLGKQLKEKLTLVIFSIEKFLSQCMATIQSYEMSNETQEFVNTLMLEFRELVLGIHEERRDLKEKLNKFPPLQPLTSLSTASPSTPAPTVTASPVDEPSTATISSATLSTTTATTGSTKPPPYKSIVRIAPQAPNRTRRRNIINISTNKTNNIITMSQTSSSVARGALIILEGLDRVGKSTLAKKLVEHLERIKRPVSYFRFPDRSTPTGHLINDFLKNSSKRIDDHAMHLLFSANRWELNKRIRQTLNQGTTVVVDRYSYSGIAYSCAKRDLTIEWCCETEKGLPKPDLVIYLELPNEVQYNRPGFGDERFENKELQELIRHQYERLIEISLESWIRIDVDNKSPDQVLGEIIVPVKRCLEACASKELGNLDFQSKQE